MFCSVAIILQILTNGPGNLVLHKYINDIQRIAMLTHISICGPRYFLPSNTSGAAYGGLPHQVASGSLPVKKLPNPKSENKQNNE